MKIAPVNLKFLKNIKGKGLIISPRLSNLSKLIYHLIQLEQAYRLIQFEKAYHFIEYEQVFPPMSWSSSLIVQNV